MKLFNVEKSGVPLVNIFDNVTMENIDLEKDLKTLSNHTYGLCSVGNVYDSVAAESLTFVDDKNVILYNEYTKLLADRMGVTAPPTISMESLSEEGIRGANYHISLEGWMSDMWKKIKEVFETIYNKVKEFFNTYFTRLGRLKKSLQNLQQVLGSTNKDMGDPSMVNPPEGLLRTFGGRTEVSANAISETIASVKILVGTLGEINKAAEGFANEGVMDADFIKTIKKLKDEALKASQDSEANRKDRSNTKLIGDGDKKKDLDAKNQSLQEIAKNSEEKGNEMASDVLKVGEADTGDEEANRKKAQQEFDNFLKAVLDSFEKVKGKALVGGKTVKNVSSSPEEGLTVEMDDEAKPATALVMAGKSSLSSLVAECLDLIKNAETDVKNYGSVNDIVKKSFKAIDTLVSDIDKIDPEKFGKYKKVINESVRFRLQLLRKFFSTYNKTCKNVLDMSMDVCDGAVKYSVLSLKHFE